MKTKLNLENIIVAGLQIGKLEMEYEGTVLEIKESIELLPLLMNTATTMQSTLEKQVEQKEPPQEEKKEIVTPITEPVINLESLQNMGITPESLQKLFQGGK